MTLGNEFAKALMSAGKELHTEKKRRDRNRAQSQRYRPQAECGPSLKDAVFSVMEEAMAQASGNGVYAVPGRTLYYKVRPLIQDQTDRELNYTYFSQNLLVAYQQEHGSLTGLVREARGNLHEPHTGKTVPLGTLEVADYKLPEYVFSKILYVEKEGLDPIWQTARLAERYDLAIASGKGQPVEAVRDLFERAGGDEYRLFVLHDADPAGYSIARTISEETARMPDYSVEVIDLGLTVADAIEHGLPTETFNRSKALPYWMDRRLSATEREWFQGKSMYGYRNSFRCTRVELNAFSAPDLVAYVEAGLAANGADDKIMPPDEVLAEQATTAHSDAVKSWIAERVAEMFDTDAMAETIVSETAADVVDDPAGWITEAYDEDRSSYWRTVISNEIEERLDKDRLETRFLALVNKATAERADGEA
jgi:hypothetical protein